jgi:excisionase family DNA binding protein
MESPLLDKQQAADFLNTSIWHIEYLIRHRRIPFVRVGPKIIRFKRDDLEEWIEASRIEAVD